MLLSVFGPLMGPCDIRHHGYMYVKYALLSELKSAFALCEQFIFQNLVSSCFFFCSGTEANAVTHFTASAGIALLSHPRLQC